MIIHTSVPSGADGLSSNKLLPGVNWLYGWDFTQRWSLSGSTQIYKATDLVPLPTSRGGTRQDDTSKHAFTVVAQSFSMEYEADRQVDSLFRMVLALSPGRDGAGESARSTTRTPALPTK